MRHGLGCLDGDPWLATGSVLDQETSFNKMLGGLSVECVVWLIQSLRSQSGRMNCAALTSIFLASD